MLVRKNIGRGVHIQRFEQLKPPKPPVPEGLSQIFDVVELMYKGKTYTKAVKTVAKRRDILESALGDKCTRNLKLNTKQFVKIAENKNRFKNF